MKGGGGEGWISDGHMKTCLCGFCRMVSFASEVDSSVCSSRCAA